MDIHFGIIGQVIVEDMRNIVNIESTCGDIGRDQHFQLIRTETSQHTFARILIQVTVNGFSGDAAYDQFVREVTRLCARAGEDQGTLDRFDLKEARQAHWSCPIRGRDNSVVQSLKG